MGEQEAGDATGLDRRQMIKKTVAGAAAAGVVWSAPRVEGLSLRPDYAAAGSDPGVNQTELIFNFPTDAPAFPTANVFSGELSVTASILANNTSNFSRRIVLRDITYDGAGNVNVSGTETNTPANVSLNHLSNVLPVPLNSPIVYAQLLGSPVTAPHYWRLNVCR